jgi:glycine/D-amino acid oxidase-like deaminating enzyme
MRIAIVGAGVAGLALSYFLLDQPGVEVTLFDPKGAGGGASGVSTGLLHPFPGKNALRSWRASEGMEATWNLISEVEKIAGHPVAERTGIIRTALSDRQVKDFRKRARLDPEAIWWEPEELLAQIPHATPAPALWIPSGGTVYSPLYLQALAQAAQKKGVRFEPRRVRATEELADFDQIVLATGFETTQFAECAHLPLEPTKGHVLVCHWPGERLPCSLVSMGHISATEDPHLCQIGSTYEHNFKTLQPDPRAIQELKTKAAAFYPPAADFEVIDLKVGIRTSPKEGYRPLIERLSPKLWVFTGLGSRGLLYHALLGRELAAQILIKDAR